MKRPKDNLVLETLEGSRWNSAIIVLLMAIPLLSVVGYGAVDAWALSLLSLGAGVLVILWAADAWKNGELRYSPNIIQVPLIGLIIIGAFQLLPLWGSGMAPDLIGVPAAGTLSMDPYATRFFVIRLVVLFLFFAAALAFIDTSGRIRKVVITIIIFGGLMAFVAILMRLASPNAIYGLRPTPQAISFGSFVNQHHFAAFMEMTAGVTLGLLIGDSIKKDRKMLLAIAAALMGIAVVFTSSRGGLLSLIAVIGAVVILQYFNRKEDLVIKENNSRSGFLKFGIAASAVLIILVTTVFLGGGDSLIRAFGLTQNHADVTSGRLHFWSVAWQIFTANPVLGAGYDAFGVAFSRYDTWTGNFRIEQAHNEYLQILADAGIVGFGCVAAFIFVFFRKSLGVIRDSKNAFGRDAAIGALAGCTGILIHSFFDFPLRTTSNAFFFLLLVVIAVAGFDVKRRKA